MISVVIPCRNEAANLPELIAELSAALLGREHEIIIVDDGSTDATGAVVAELARAASGALRALRHDQPAGKSAALKSGVFSAHGDIIVTVDGDGQNDPIYVPKLADALLAAGPAAGIVAGQRLRRTDTRLKRLSSRVANGLRQAVLRDDTRDSACGLKALHADLFRQLPFFDNCHRYLPALVLREGRGVVHLDVVDRPRRHGRSHYGILDRGLAGIPDLLGVWWLRRRRRVVPVVTEHDRSPPPS